MAALTFPAAPAHLSTYTDPNQAIWQWDSDGPVWNVITSTTRKNFSGAKREVINTGFSVTNTFLPLVFENEIYEVDNYFINSNSAATAPTTGFYGVAANILSGTQGSGSSYTAELRVNNIKNSEIQFGPNQSVTIDDTLELVQGDVVEIYIKETIGVGEIIEGSTFTMYRIGFSPGTGISNHNAFSGVKAIITQVFNTTSIPQPITWGTTSFNANANVLGDLYWYSAVQERVTTRANGYFKLRSFIKAGIAGSNDSYTVTIKKNRNLGSEVDLYTTNLGPNDFVQLNETIYLLEDDFLELVVSNSDNTGNVTTDTYLELVREGL